MPRLYEFDRSLLLRGARIRARLLVWNWVRVWPRPLHWIVLARFPRLLTSGAFVLRHITLQLHCNWSAATLGACRNGKGGAIRRKKPVNGTQGDAVDKVKNEGPQWRAR